MSTIATTAADYVAPTPRIASLPAVAPDGYRAMRALAASVTLDATLHHLIEIRVSQLNGCAFCLDMHLTAARAAGETTQRLDTLAGWRESPFFTASERAALALAEALTHIVDSHVPDAVYDEAARHFDDAELMQVTFAITVINGWNRLMLTTQTPPPVR